MTFGIEGPRAVITRQRDPDELNAERARARDGGTRCAEIPAELVGAIVAALRAAKAGGPR